MTYFVQHEKAILQCDDGLPKLARHTDYFYAVFDVNEKASLKKQHPNARWIKFDQAKREIRQQWESMPGRPE